MSDTKETKLKRKFISLEDKIRILNRLKDGEKISSVAKSVNLNESTIRTVKKNEEKIRRTMADCCPLGVKCVTRARNINMVKMERTLMIWLEDCMAKKIPLSSNFIKQKALEIYENLKNIGHSSAGLDHSFSASKGWFEKLKNRYSLRNIKFQGERALTDAVAAKNCEQDLVQAIDEGGCTPDFNADETEFYPKKLPFRTFISKTERRAEELVDASISNVLEDKNMENELMLKFNLDDVKKGLHLAEELEFYFIQADPSTSRSAKFKRELKNCLAPYREILVELEKKAAIESQHEHLSNKVHTWPIKKRIVKTLSFT